MKNIAKAFAQLGLYNKVLVLIVLGAWLLLTLALAQNWRHISQVVAWFNGQFSLGVAISLVQIAILVNIWYKLGGTNASIRHGEKERKNQDRRIHQNRVQIAELRGEVEVLKSIVIVKKEEEGNETENRNLA